MTGIESPVTITGSNLEVTARCECGWATSAYAGDGFARWARRRVHTEWAEHWHDIHAEGDNE